MKRALILAVLALGLAAPSPTVEAAPPPSFAQRSVSSSRQFIVYSSDVRLRLAVTGFVETAKSTVLDTLGIQDHWKLPIVITLRPRSTALSRQPASQLLFLNTDEGSKLEIIVNLHQNDLKEARFPQQVIQAVLTEIAYRGQIPGDGEAYNQPPAWLVEGIAERLQSRLVAEVPKAALFRQLIETGKLPKIRDFLSSNIGVMDSTSRAIYAACSFSLMEMLTELPNGRASLAKLVRDLPNPGGDPVARLLETFPTLGKNEAALEKWWTLGLARWSASDRYMAGTVEETNARIAPLLTFEIVTDVKKGTKTRFGFADFKKFVKLKTTKPVMLTQAAAFASILPNAHPLLRPVVLEYQRISDNLANGKTKHVPESLQEVENYRELVVARMEKINDYLNWFEATQMPGRSGAFDSYLKTAGNLEKLDTTPKRNDPLSRYVDQVEREFQ